MDSPIAEAPALEAIGLRKAYGPRLAVNGVDLVVRAGVVHGLLGPNGAGKTTLLRMLLGLVQPDAGTVRLLGRGAGTAESAMPGGVAGFVDPSQFYPYLSARRNLGLLARLDGTAGPGVRDRLDAVLDQVGLASRADAKVGGYSAGMRQRLALAAALLRSPRLLLLDEPTSSLDPAGARELRAHVRRLASEGVAIVLSSHDMPEVEDLCSALTILHHGRVAFSGTIEELRMRAAGAVHRLRTADDARARTIGAAVPGLELTEAPDGGGLDVKADEATLDAYAIELGRAGLAIRSLEARERALEALFLRLTAGGAEPEAAPAPPPDPRPRDRSGGRVTARGAFAVVRVECEKLLAQIKVWVVLATCLGGPFAFVAAMRLQSSMPEDTLFGRWVKASGFAVPLVVLGFAAAWAFPALTSVVSGDLFSAEDRYGTWPTVLTRSRTHREVFLGKILTALLFSLAMIGALGVSSTVAGVLGVGREPLLGLSGTLLPPGRALAGVAAAWASVGPPAMGFAALAVLISVATRSSAAGIALPVVLGFVMELLALVNAPDLVRRALLTTPLVSWHGIFADPPFYGPLLEGTIVSLVYFAGCLAAAYALLRRRDMGG